MMHESSINIYCWFIFPLVISRSGGKWTNSLILCGGKNGNHGKLLKARFLGAVKDSFFPRIWKRVMLLTFQNGSSCAAVSPHPCTVNWPFHPCCVPLHGKNLISWDCCLVWDLMPFQRSYVNLKIQSEPRFIESVPPFGSLMDYG